MWLGTLIPNMEIHIDVMYTNIVSITFKRLPAYLCRLLFTFANSFGPRSGWTKHRASSGSKLIDTLIIFLREFFKKEF